MIAIAHPRSLLICVILICAYSLQLGAQQAKPPKNDSEADKVLRGKAFELLESLADQLATLRSAENRARLGSNIADSIWTHDEQRARQLFAGVEEDIKLGYKQSGNPEDQNDVHTMMVFLKLRSDTIERIANHDVAFALAFLKATALSNDKLLPYAAESDRVLEVRLAQQLAALDPDVALKFGRQSLERGFPPELVQVLKQLNRGHQEQARLLHKDIVAKLGTVDLATDWAALTLAQNLARTFTPPSAEDSTFRELINIFIKNAAAKKCDKRDPEETWSFCYQIGPLLAQLQKIDPRAQKFAHVDDDDSRPYELQAGMDELNSLEETGSAEETLALLTKYPSLAVEIQSRALRKARRVGDVELQRKIVADFKGDPETRMHLEEQVARDESWLSVDEEKLIEIQTKAASLPRVMERLEYLFTAAARISQTNRPAALKLLEELGAQAETLKPGKERLQVQMGLALTYCSLNSDRGLSMMASVVPKLNELVDAAAKLDGFDINYLRDGEWNMSGEGAIGSLLTSLAQNANCFAYCDFDRSVKIAALFERTEIRMMAQLKLAQGILAGPPKPLWAFESY
ncbi:MAG TPA: hypothetical protein VLB68_08365 [Pyrinomonadaceae bacterium]|nr:hypothetical protein [Pyrinomonadaceae bacterium]